MADMPADPFDGAPVGERLDDPPALVVTAPTLPWEIALNDSMTFYQRHPSGGMLVKLVPVMMTPQGPGLMAPAVAVLFSAEGWERFKREVAADGVKPPVIETARTFPGGLLNGGEKT